MSQISALTAGIADLMLSLAMAILVAYSSFRIFSRMTPEIDEITELKNGNVAVGVMLASMLVAEALVVREALYPAGSSLQTFLFNGMSAVGGLTVVGLTVGYVVLVLLVAGVAIGLAARLYARLTHDVDEMGEISRGNIAIALTLGAVIIVTSLFLSRGVRSCLSALIPEPALESIHILGQP